jgi:hypothetical protein
VGRLFVRGLATTIAFVAVVAVLLLGIFIVVNSIAGPVGG